MLGREKKANHEHTKTKQTYSLYSVRAQNYVAAMVRELQEEGGLGWRTCFGDYLGSSVRVAGAFFRLCVSKTSAQIHRRRRGNKHWPQRPVWRFQSARALKASAALDSASHNPWTLRVFCCVLTCMLEVCDGRQFQLLV